jgi:rhamnosyltransferase
MGAGFSDADYLLYMTQDALPADKTLVERLLSAFRDPRVKISYARQLPSRECRVIEGYTRSFNYPSKSRVKSFDDLEELGIKTFFCSNVCACYDRVFLREMGGFSAPCIFNEDMIFAGRAIKLGYSVAYVAEARVIHSHNYSAVQQFRRNFDNGVSQAMHPEIFRGIDTEGEGGRLVKNTIKYLRSVGYGYMVPRLLFHSAAKYAGFRMGRAYKVLPRWLIHMCTMNPGFWAYKAGDD